MKKLRISVDGKAYDVEVEFLDEPAAQGPARSAPRPARSAAAPAPMAKPAPAKASPSAGPGDVASPLSAIVVTVHAQVGAAVKAGDKVVTLEAMKMNTVVSASSDGTVSAIHVASGDSVEEGQPLLTIS